MNTTEQGFAHIDGVEGHGDVSSHASDKQELTVAVPFDEYDTNPQERRFRLMGEATTNGIWLAQDSDGNVHELTSKQVEEGQKARAEEVALAEHRLRGTDSYPKQ